MLLIYTSRHCVSPDRL